MDKKKGLKNSRKFILSIVAIVVLIVSVCGFKAYRLYHGTITTISSINEVEEYGAGDFFPTDYKNYDNVSFTKNHKNKLIFQSDALTMKIKDPEKFESLKKYIVKI